MSGPGRLHPDDLVALGQLVAGVVMTELRNAESSSVPARLLTVGEVADWLALSRDHVYRMERELGAIRLGRGTKAAVRFRAETIAAWLDACSGSRESPDAPEGADPQQPRRHDAGGNPPRRPLPQTDARYCLNARDRASNTATRPTHSNPTSAVAVRG